jgi:ubiquinol-cytochrome c reductase cytochrome b subunit
MLPHGEFVEVHEPISPEKAWTLTSHTQPVPLANISEDANGVAKPKAIRNKIRARMSAANAEQAPAATVTEAKELEGGHH